MQWTKESDAAASPLKVSSKEDLLVDGFCYLLFFSVSRIRERHFTLFSRSSRAK